jgi:beta-lactamase class A
LTRLRAGLPPGWRAGDKTGSGRNGAINDVAIAWPPGRAPLLLGVYASGGSAPLERFNAAHASIARRAVEVLVAG